MMHVPVVVYADFESILRSLRDREKNKTHEHIPCGFCFHLVSPFLQMEPVLKRAENETNQLPQDFIRELISQVKQAHLSLPKKETIPLGGIYGISRGTFFQGIEIVALTAVRATI